jgi:glycosyltransferase involved in cell wall biosynthesis
VDRAHGCVVSVIIVTYQHERFVGQAIESVLSQRTDFPIEILISEDLSPDRTREIVTDFQRRHPEIIRLFLSERNQNDNAVIARAWSAARGRYIAMLDGDDYWTDPRKLQKQVQFLEQHPDVFVCGHAVSVVDEEGHERTRPRELEIREDRYLSPEDLAAGDSFPILSTVFRNNGRLPPDAAFNAAFNADAFMLAFFANFGGGYVSHKVMGAYREHPGGVWSTLDARRATDYRNTTLSSIPAVLTRSLRSIAYAKLFRHAVKEDYRWWRKLRQAPYAALMTLISLTPRSAIYLVKRLIGR